MYTPSYNKNNGFGIHWYLLAWCCRFLTTYITNYLPMVMLASWDWAQIISSIVVPPQLVFVCVVAVQYHVLQYENCYNYAYEVNLKCTSKVFVVKISVNDRLLRRFYGRLRLIRSVLRASKFSEWKIDWNCNFVCSLHNSVWLQLVLALLGHHVSIF